MTRAALVLATVLAVAGWASAQTPVDQKRPAAPEGTVSIENMAGTMQHFSNRHLAGGEAHSLA